jgi:predicted GNAT family N-acyltransferase
LCSLCSDLLSCSQFKTKYIVIHYREIEFGTPEYDETVKLRMDVLRVPLGISFETDALEKEFSDHHLCAVEDDGRIAGCLVMTPIDDQEVQMRQFAVASSHQRKGIGSELVKFAEKWSADHGFKIIMLHARKTAVPFYLRLNYDLEGDEFIEVSIPHNLMRKVMNK